MVTKGHLCLRRDDLREHSQSSLRDRQQTQSHIRKMQPSTFEGERKCFVPDQSEMVSQLGQYEWCIQWRPTMCSVNNKMV